MNGSGIQLRWKFPASRPLLPEHANTHKFGGGRPREPDRVCADAIFSMNLGTAVGLITDGRFSGFNRGPVVGHVSPEAAIGGPLALVDEGDEIEIDVPGRRLQLLVGPEELERRREAWRPPHPKTRDGVLALYAQMAAPPEEGAAMQPWATRPATPAPLVGAPVS